MGRPPKDYDATDDTLTQKRPLGLSEIGDPGPIERVSESDFIEVAKTEKFMNDILTIIVHESVEDGSLEIITPSVNGVNQPIIRGIESNVKRKYVETLARSRMTKYVQKTPDPSRPDNIQMVERTSLTYPFSVLHDPHPNGRAWLKAILAQPQ